MNVQEIQNNKEKCQELIERLLLIQKNFVKAMFGVLIMQTLICIMTFYMDSKILLPSILGFTIGMIYILYKI